MTDERTAAAELLADRPDLEPALRALVERDADGPWTFDDTALDSGAFGELVSREFVESAGEGYRFTDRVAVRRALDSESGDTSETGASTVGAFRSPNLSLPSVDRRAAAALAGTLLLLVLFRSFSLPAVFRGGDVVLTANDPYYYRYLVEKTLRGVDGGFIPETARVGEPLLVATLAAVSMLLGGSTGAVGLVLALYPLLAAVVTGVLVYLLATRLTGDRRIGLASVAMLAITPVHAYRTSLGFADHHAFDYVWLALTVVALVYALTREVGGSKGRRVGLLATVALGVGISAQLLAWDAGALLVLPVGGAVALASVSAVRADESPLETLWPVAAGAGLGAVLTFLTHLGLGWQSTTLASVSAVLFGGAVICVAAGEVASRRGLGYRSAVGIEGVAVLGLVGAYFLVVPSSGFAFDSGVDELFGTAGAVEAGSMFGQELGTLIGPLFLFGLVFVLGLPYLLWATWRAWTDHAPEWAAMAVYGWFLLVLSVVQLRFAGELSVFVAVFAGVGFVHLASKLDVAAVPDVVQGGSNRGRRADGGERTELAMPERREAMTTLGLGAMVGSLSLVQTPIKTSQLTHGEEAYELAMAMREYADEHGLEYPESYVLSEWGSNRFYNYFVNGESRSYAYARSNYSGFVGATDGERWYRKLEDRTGFVVVDRENPEEGGPLYSQLQSFANGDPSVSGVGHYRAVGVTESKLAYELVPGVLLTGPASDGSSVRTMASVDLPDRGFEYDRRVSSRHGVYAVRVAYPGEYTVGGRTVDVSDSEIRSGTRRSFFEGDGISYWSFDAGEGSTAYDRVGGNHAAVEDASWTSGVRESALSFDSEEGSQAIAGTESGSFSAFTVSSWIEPRTQSSGAILSVGKDGGADSTSGFLFDHGLSGWVDDRLGLFVGDGDRSAGARSPSLDLSYPTNRFHHVAVVFERGAVTWFLDGRQIGRGSIPVSAVDFGDASRVRIGREATSYGDFSRYDGSMDELRLFGEALPDERIVSLYRESAVDD
ncbi:LamG-like jellyroll fold domain-containing protein [Halobium salinum]|uniref:dolichyl-phosphooligosaccharide-protein glycotransferase n=1 Tax=Halobium salinum TaxID=1364940 RepID=A0ABD5PAM2_9EURY|nr:LamG-like jellyroll fold domain-containing protein [Halobium salinum]